MLDRRPDADEIDAGLTYIQSLRRKWTRLRRRKGVAELLPCSDGVERIYLRVLRLEIMDIRSLITKSSESSQLSRRAMLRAAGCGFGFLGLDRLLAEAARPGRRGRPARARSRRISRPGPNASSSCSCTAARRRSIPSIPSRISMRNDGKPLPIKQPLTFAAGKTGALMKSPWAFKHGGQSGLPVSDLFPHIRECADDLCVVRSMVGEGVDHGAALLQTFTGTFTFTRPEHGLLGALRPGHGKSQSAGLHHD